MAAGQTVSPMTDGDLPAVLAIEAVSFPVPWTEAMFRAEFGREFAFCRVIRDAATAVAYAVFWITTDELNLHILAVDPAQRGRGLGVALMDAMHAEAAQRGARRALLEVRVSNTPAIALYARCGYAVIGRRRGYYQNDGEDALVMARDLASPEAA
jgi:ribosomal-protein-alanine N-acetyltransferase